MSRRIVSLLTRNIPASFRALASRNYRLFLTGQGVSLIGTWMQQTGIQWLVWLRSAGNGGAQ